LLPHVSEISFPIQQRDELRRLRELDLIDPASALGVFIDKFGLAGQRLVHTKHFAAYRRIEVARGLDRLDNADCAVLLHLRADVRELDSGHVAEFFLSLVCYPNSSDAVLDDDVLVILGVSNLHGLSPTISAGKFGPEHRQTALRLGLGCFVLQNVPMFGEQAVGHSDDIGGDPILRPSSVREPAVNDHVIAFGNDGARLISQRRWRAADQVEQAVASGLDVRTVLDVVR
jgi:hypothetical protein